MAQTMTLDYIENTVMSVTVHVHSDLSMYSSFSSHLPTVYGILLYAPRGVVNGPN